MADTINQNSQGDNTVIVRFEINKFTQLGERGVSAFSRARQLKNYLVRNLLKKFAQLQDSDVKRIADLFCEEQIVGDSMVCSVNDIKTPIESIIPFYKLSQREKNKVIRYIFNTLSFIRNLAYKKIKETDSRELNDILYFFYSKSNPEYNYFGSFLRFPRENCIFLVNGLPVVTMWGFADFKDSMRELYNAQPISDVVNPLEDYVADLNSLDEDVEAPEDLKDILSEPVENIFSRSGPRMQFGDAGSYSLNSDTPDSSTTNIDSTYDSSPNSSSSDDYSSFNNSSNDTGNNGGFDYSSAPNYSSDYSGDDLSENTDGFKDTFKDYLNSDDDNSNGDGGNSSGDFEDTTVPKSFAETSDEEEQKENAETTSQVSSDESHSTSDSSSSNSEEYNVNGTYEETKVEKTYFSKASIIIMSLLGLLVLILIALIFLMLFRPQYLPNFGQNYYQNQMMPNNQAPNQQQLQGNNQQHPQGNTQPQNQPSINVNVSNEQPNQRYVDSGSTNREVIVNQKEYVNPNQKRETVIIDSPETKSIQNGARKTQVLAGRNVANSKTQVNEELDNELEAKLLNESTSSRTNKTRSSSNKQTSNGRDSYYDEGPTVLNFVPSGVKYVDNGTTKDLSVNPMHYDNYALLNVFDTQTRKYLCSLEGEYTKNEETGEVDWNFNQSNHPVCSKVDIKHIKCNQKDGSSECSNVVGSGEYKIDFLNDEGRK